MEKLAVISGGELAGFATALARLLGRNATRHAVFDDCVRLFVGANADNVNAAHEDAKHLPGCMLPPNVVAFDDAAEAATGATMIVLCTSIPSLTRLLPMIKAAVAPRCKALSAIKGIDIHADCESISLASDLIRAQLGCDTSVMMGANSAHDLAFDVFCETTLGFADATNGALFKLALEAQSFRVGLTRDAAGVELCGVLQHIVTLGACVCHILETGLNTKSTIIRVGLSEMKRFGTALYQGVEGATFLESCGLANLVANCFDARNEAFALAFAAARGQSTLSEMLRSDRRMLQCALTAKVVHAVLVGRGIAQQFPFFTQVYKIAFEDAALESITTTRYSW